MTYRWLKWRDDHWLSKQGTIIPYDKAEHALGSAILAYFATFFMPLLFACLLIMVAGYLWEVKDGYMHYEVYGWFGGEGFSWKDLIADFVGILIIFVWKF